MSALTKFLRRFASNESGATAIEYGLIVSLIFLAIITAISSVADKNNAMYAVISGAM